MTLNILFFSITISKRNYTAEELVTEKSIQSISEKIKDRKCEMYHMM